jgi:Glycosyl hydrolase family 26
MSLSTTGLRAVAARLGTLAQRVVTLGNEHRAAAAAAVIIVAEVAAVAIIGTAPPQPGGIASVRQFAGVSAANVPAQLSSPVRASLPRRYTGVYEPTGAGSYVPLGRGDRAANRPLISVTYSGWYAGFKTGFADAARTVREIPLIEIEPSRVSLAAIARGAFDSYLRAYADAVASYQGTVVIGFGQEMNERLYSWGYEKTSPAVFVRAWQRVVDVFRSQRANKVIWIWTIGKSSATSGSLQKWWPGARYVTWVGIDGYYEVPGRARLSAFAGTIARVRRITGDPVLLFGDRQVAR